MENKSTVHNRPERPGCEIRPAAAWAPGPKTNGWAAKTAQRRLPPGLKVAHVMSQPSDAVDLQIYG
jgi:hypothetical protein